MSDETQAIESKVPSHIAYHVRNRIGGPRRFYPYRCGVAAQRWPRLHCRSLCDALGWLHHASATQRGTRRRLTSQRGGRQRPPPETKGRTSL